MTAATRCRGEAALLKPDTGQVSVRIRRVSTTRAGGASLPPFDTFNLGDHVGDDPAAVAANRIRLAAAIGLSPDRVVWMNQVHGDHIEVVDGPRDFAFDDTGGLVTRTLGLALAVAGAHGARDGKPAGAGEPTWSVGAHEPDISNRRGPAVSGRTYEVPAAMAD